MRQLILEITVGCVDFDKIRTKKEIRRELVRQFPIPNGSADTTQNLPKAYGGIQTTGLPAI